MQRQERVYQLVEQLKMQVPTAMEDAVAATLQQRELNPVSRGKCS